MKEERKYSVYVHITPNGKRYIGATSSNPPSKRWMSGYGYKGQIFETAIKEFGWKNIIHKVLFTNLTQNEAWFKEKFLIKYYKTTENEYGYNVGLGGNSIGKFSVETKNKMVKNHYNCYGENNSFYNKTHSRKTKELISNKAKGRFLNIENHPRYGKRMSNETKNKIGNSNKDKLSKEKHPKAKSIICDNYIFGCIKDCAKYYEVNYSTMVSWLNGINPTSKLFIEKGLKYLEQDGALY